MKIQRLIASLVLIAGMLLNLTVMPFPAVTLAAGEDSGFLVVADFESGFPAGFVPFADSWDGSGSTTTLTLDLGTVDLPTVPGTAGNAVASVTYDIAATGSWGGGPGYGGVVHDFASTEDWSSYQSFSFWFHGSASGADLRVELKSDGADAFNSNRYEYTFTDDVEGWRFFNIPFSDFLRRYDFNPGPNPDDPINLTAMWGYGILLPGGASGYFYLDQVAVTSSAGIADFESGIPTGFVPFADSWDGSGSTTTLTLDLATVDLPTVPGTAGNAVAWVTYDIAATGSWGDGPGYGGVVHDFTSTEDWSSYQSFSFWFHGSNSGADLRVELKSDGADAFNSNRYEYTFTDNVEGWRFFTIPFSDVVRRYDFNPGPSPDDPINLTAMWGYGILLPGGASGYFYLDQVTVFGADAGGPEPPPPPEPVDVVDDFESGLPSGTDGDGNAIGFFTFVDTNGSTVAISTTDAPPQPVPEQVDPNNVLQVDTNVVSNGWAGLVHAFENEALDTWTPQDWSGYEGFSLWLYGNNTGKILFLDILDNRAPGSTEDTAERFSVDIPDNFSGWQLIQIPFTDFHRKDINNGAPNDGFTLTEVHGWAFGVFSSAMAFTNYLDDVGLYGVAEIPELAVSFSTNNFDVDEGTTGDIAVKLNRPMNEDDPAQVSVDYASEPGTATADRDYAPVAGTLTFVYGGPSEQAFPLQTFDDNKYEGEERVILRLSNPVDVAPGTVMQAAGTIVDDDPLDPTLIDDFERGAYLWTTDGDVTLATPEIAAGDALAVPEQGAYEHILEATTPILIDFVVDGNLCNQGNGVVTVAILTTESFDALSVDHTTVLFGDAAETHVDKKTGEARRHEADFDGDGDLDLIFHFRVNETGYDCQSTQLTLTGETFTGQPIVSGGEGGLYHDFPIGQDWTDGEALSFWFYGTDSGDAITVQLKDNRKPGHGHWSLVWADEFDDPAGTPPKSANWTHELGDGTVNGIPGWGNDELQYYTDSTENAATDGNGNLVITAGEADASLMCYYGPCEYTSARLISLHKAEFAYGRVEARIRVPQGAGLWPAFWSLGTDIGEVGWPQTGEIDIMEFVGREPYEVFGTIHGPGYSGGESFGNTYTFDVPVYEDYHTFAIEWQPDKIKWYVDDMLYHEARPADVDPNEWVFNHPFYILMNVAVGGNFGGPVGEDTTFPQEMLVDYVRVYQGPDSAERFEASFTDNFDGWQQVVIPFSSFTRSADQPASAPDDGLGLNEVWGYGFKLPEGGTSTGTLRLDQVRLEVGPPPPPEIVTNLNDSGSGSLRQALEDIASGGTITFDPSLAGGTITLTSGPLVPSKNVTIDASDAPGLIVSGNHADRVLIVEAGFTVSVNDMTLADGYGWDLAGGILNNGTLHLSNCVVTNSTAATDSFNPDTDFWKGGGGIYNGGGATLTLVDSTVSGNSTTLIDGGGIYTFPGSTTSIVRSTISANTAANTGGGMRTLGDVTIVNSTISGNEALGWYGGAIFHTDGVMDILNSTIANNIAPDWAPSAIFLGSYDPAVVPVLSLTNTIITGNQGYACEPFASGGVVSLVSGGHNLVQDNSCSPAPSDLIDPNAGIGPLADNGGPTWTHALLLGSPAIDAGDDSVCPATDQRGVLRPQGAACDIGSFELE